MAKRFTDTDKWKKKWFRELPIIIKCFWFYLLDNCDNSGVWEVDYELAGYQLGINIDKGEVDALLGSRIVYFNNDKMLIRDFVDYQYGDLRENCKPHQHIIKLQKKHKGYPKGIQRVSNTLKDKDKDKDKDKEKEKDTSGNAVICKDVIDYLNIKCGKNYKHNTDKTRRSILARTSEGFCLEDFKKVVDVKYADWNDDPEMRKYLRPETLFGTKMDGYVNETVEDTIEDVLKRAAQQLEKENPIEPIC